MKRRAITFFLFTCAAVSVGCVSGNQSIRHERGDVPLYDGLGTHHMAVTASSEQAQRYFDQGLIWAYAFNHDEAIRSFKKATEIDPNCAMAWWGIALCNGPHINNPVVPATRSQAAWDALQRALELQDRVTEKERALILALNQRYTDPAPEDRSELDKAYATAMGSVWARFRSDPDMGTLYAEALMDLHPWDLWTKEGEEQPWTRHILDVLEQAMRLQPDNPGANHLYIHAVEASSTPELANASADRLRDLVPFSGHLVHMPSHIDVLTGRWEQASLQNEKAIRADAKFRKVAPNPGFYHLYMAHNHHMLAFASMMEGRHNVALQAARDVVENVPDDYLKENAALLDPFMAAVYDVHKRFGRWDDMLKEPAPPKYLKITTAMWHFTRGIAYAAKGDVAGAMSEREAFRKAADAIPDDAMMAINPANSIMQIAAHMLNGEIALRQGSIDECISELRNAIEIEDNLVYMEPPEWMQPMRHTLGAVLLRAGRHEEAERVYREDLKNWPNNGWSLYGLSRCLKAQGKAAEATAVDAQLKKTWARADTELHTSCMCVPKV